MDDDSPTLLSQPGPSVSSQIFSCIRPRVLYLHQRVRHLPLPSPIRFLFTREVGIPGGCEKGYRFDSSF